MLLLSCQPLATVSQVIGSADPLEINAATVDALLGDTPEEFYTDYSAPHHCAFSPIKPASNEPNWVRPETVWQRIRLGYQMQWDQPQPRIDAEFNWYHNNPGYMARVSERAQRYIYHVTEQLEQHNLPLELALLPIVESAYDPFAYSHGRASGMWQFIPGTGRMFKLNQDWWYDGRRDVVASTTAAISYLQSLNRYYDGDWLLALAAYNSGQGNVNKAIRKNKKRGKATDFWSLDLPAETRSYVPKLLALAKLMDNPQRYNTELFPVPNQPYFAEVDTVSQIDLAQAARLAGIDIDELYRLNPGFNRWATSPKGPHRLLIPVANRATFETALAQLPATERLHWQRYIVKDGDSLILLAKRFNTRVATIQQVNKLRGAMIRTGQALMIPTASQQDQHYSLSAEQRLATIHQQRTGGTDSQQHFHRVQSGESLWTISRRYKVSVAQLAHWNGMAPKDMLKPGQKLSVWLAPMAKAKTIGQRESVVRKIGYTVRRGDSLARIAGRFNVRISDIVRWNRVNPKKYLRPGQYLKLYVNITNAMN